MARCPECGTVVAKAKKTWTMYGRPDSSGNRIELVIGLFDCPKCKRPFRIVLSKRKIGTKEKSYRKIKARYESSQRQDAQETHTRFFERYARDLVKPPSFFNNNFRAFFTQASFSIFLLNLLAGEFVVYRPEIWANSFLANNRGYQLFFIYFLVVGLILILLEGFIVAGIYGFDFTEGSMCYFNAWGGWFLGTIMSLFFSYYSVSTFSGNRIAFWIETIAVSISCFYFAFRSYSKDSWLAHATNFVRRGDILSNKGDLYEAIRCYVKSALATRSHPNSKIARISIESYEDLAVDLATVSILRGDATKIIPFLTDCQKKLKRVEAYKQKTLKVDQILKSLISGSNIHLIFGMFLDTDSAKSFINKLLGHTRAVKLSALAAEYNYDEKMLQTFLETAVANGKIEGFLTTDKKIFITKDFLQEQLYDKLTS
ncbi:MAG: hypothetical protein QXU46_02175 [Candidatus Bathyarchaeia archaeon]